MILNLVAIKRIKNTSHIEGQLWSYWNLTKQESDDFDWYLFFVYILLFQMYVAIFQDALRDE